MLVQWWHEEGSHLCAGAEADAFPHVLDLFGDSELIDAEEECPEWEGDIASEGSEAPAPTKTSSGDDAAANLLDSIERTNELQTACLHLLQQTETEENADVDTLVADNIQAESEVARLPPQHEPAALRGPVHCLGDVLTYVSKKSSCGEDFVKKQLARSCIH